MSEKLAQSSFARVSKYHWITARAMSYHASDASPRYVLFPDRSESEFAETKHPRVDKRLPHGSLMTMFILGFSAMPPRVIMG